MPSPLVDSECTLAAALAGLPSACPDAVRRRQALVDVEHPGFDGEVRRGQVVIDERLAHDVRAVFALALGTGFPIGSAIPLADARFAWDDVRSMDANNSSGFNWRTIAGTGRLSWHAFGQAFDLNPRQNPWSAPHGVQPAGAVHDPSAPGTLTLAHPIVQAFLERGWEWGGTWTGTVDLHHFQKPLEPR
jgi:hypothetical protein